MITTTSCKTVRQIEFEVPRGRPPVSWEQCVTEDLHAQQLPSNMHELKGVCELRGWWRSMLRELTHPLPDEAGMPFRRSRVAAQRHSTTVLRRADRLRLP
jgi:hypothetical protein